MFNGMLPFAICSRKVGIAPVRIYARGKRWWMDEKCGIKLANNLLEEAEAKKCMNKNITVMSPEVQTSTPLMQCMLALIFAIRLRSSPSSRFVDSYADEYVLNALIKGILLPARWIRCSFWLLFAFQLTLGSFIFYWKGKPKRNINPNRAKHFSNSHGSSGIIIKSIEITEHWNPIWITKIIFKLKLLSINNSIKLTRFDSYSHSHPYSCIGSRIRSHIRIRLWIKWGDKIFDCRMSLWILRVYWCEGVFNDISLNLIHIWSSC